MASLETSDLISNNPFVVYNTSPLCHAETPPDHQNFLILLHHAFGLFFGPANALLNGVCVYIFQHSSWRKSTMSRILKGLSIVEMLMGLCLFFHAILFYEPHLSSADAPGSSPNARNQTTRPDNLSSLANNHTTVRLDDTHSRIQRTLITFVLTTLFSRGVLAFQIARNWSVVLLAAYRYDRICRPVASSSAFVNFRVKYIFALLVILSILITLPRCVESGIVLCSHDGVYAGPVNLLTASSIYQYVYLGALMFLVQSGGPVICVSVLSGFVIRLIAKRRKLHRLKERQTASNILRLRPVPSRLTADGVVENPSENDIAESSKGRSENSAPKTVSFDRPMPSGDKLIFAICVTFFVLETPAFFSKILHPLLDRQYECADMVFAVVANLFIYIDSTLNAFVYMASNPTFRKIAYQKCRHLRSVWRFQADDSLASGRSGHPISHITSMKAEDTTIAGI